jgi:hypothetical protein
MTISDARIEISTSLDLTHKLTCYERDAMLDSILDTVETYARGFHMDIMKGVS